MFLTINDGKSIAITVDYNNFNRIFIFFFLTRFIEASAVTADDEKKPSLKSMAIIDFKRSTFQFRKAHYAKKGFLLQPFNSIEQKSHDIRRKLFASHKVGSVDTVALERRRLFAAKKSSVTSFDQPAEERRKAFSRSKGESIDMNPFRAAQRRRDFASKRRRVKNKKLASLSWNFAFAVIFFVPISTSLIFMIKHLSLLSRSEKNWCFFAFGAPISLQWYF